MLNAIHLLRYSTYPLPHFCKHKQLILFKLCVDDPILAEHENPFAGMNTGMTTYYNACPFL